MPWSRAAGRCFSPRSPSGPSDSGRSSWTQRETASRSTPCDRAEPPSAPDKPHDIRKGTFDGLPNGPACPTDQGAESRKPAMNDGNAPGVEVSVLPSLAGDAADGE